MKNTLLLLGFLISIIGFGQNNIGINETGTIPDPSAGLDIDFTDKGILLPRLTTAERDNITNPAHSLLIFNTTTDCYESYNATNSTWQNFGCLTASQSFNCGDVIIDSRDGISYTTVLIGAQCWMAENLNHDPGSGNSWCYNNDANNCNTYGRLYTWDEAMNSTTTSNTVPSGVQGACPTGWHLPSDAEWDILANHLGGLTNAALALKEQGPAHWGSSNNGTNSSGFTALPAGHRGNSGNFILLGEYANWWTTTESTATQVYRYYINNATDTELRRNTHEKTTAQSVRCILD